MTTYWNDCVRAADARQAIILELMPCVESLYGFWGFLNESHKQRQLTKLLNR
jgi:hypothetical protein